MQLRDGGVHDANRVGILRADVKDADLRAGEPARDHHAEQHRVRALLHEILVDVCTGVAFVGIAHDVFHLASARAAGGPFEVEREPRAAASAQAGVLEFAREPVAILFQQLPERREVFLHAGKWRGELGGLQVRDNGIAILRVTFAAGKEFPEVGLRLPGKVPPFKLKRPALVAPPETADVPDFLLLEMPAQRMMQLLLRPRHEARRAVADKHLFFRVLLFQKIIKRHRPQRDRVAKQRLFAECPHGLRRSRGARLVRSLHHALEQILVGAFAKGEGTEVFGHEIGEWVCGIQSTDAGTLPAVCSSGERSLGATTQDAGGFVLNLRRV